MDQSVVHNISGEGSIESNRAKQTKADFFGTSHLMGDLKGRSVRGGVVTVAGQGAKFSVKMISTVVLARLLTPADFGLIAMVAGFTGFVGMFKDLGLTMATVQRAEINHQQVSTLFWVNVGLGLVLAAITAALGPFVAWFYNEPQLTSVTIAIGLTFIFGGISAQHMALLRRQMKFKSLAFAEIISMAGGVAAAVLLAIYGAGYWALVGLVAFQELVLAVVTWLMTGWIPGRAVFDRQIKPLLCYGGNLTGFNIVNYFTRNADNIMIGAVLGAAALGIYTKAYGLLLLPLSQINVPVASVAIPALSRLQDDEVAFRRFYYNAIRLLAYVTMPLVMILAILAFDLVHILLGRQWTDVVPIFQVLAIFGVIQSISTTTGWVLTSLGRTRRMLKWTLFGTPCIILAFAIGLTWGALGVAIAATICAFLLVLPHMIFCYRNTPISVREVFIEIALPLLFSFVVFVSGIFLRRTLPPEPSFLPVLIVVGATAVIGVLWVFLIPPARHDFRRVWQIVFKKNIDAISGVQQ